MINICTLILIMDVLFYKIHIFKAVESHRKATKAITSHSGFPPLVAQWEHPFRVSRGEWGTVRGGGVNVAGIPLM